MDMEIPVLAGYLNVPSQPGFSLNRISKKKSCQRYCLLYKASRHGIERIELCESKDDKNPKIITLENCVKIAQEPSPANLIQIVKKSETLTLNTLHDEDLKEWINALQTVAFTDKSGTHEHIAIEEDNDLYCSSFGDGLFVVTLIPSDTSIRCNIEPKSYMLHLTATDLQLKSADDFNITVSNWPYRFIRKYGYRDGKFTFEAGRKCNTGEGIFTLSHTNPQEVFRCMSCKMKSMKKLISGESLINFDCGENHLNAVAAMEAGSRSPLPLLSSSENSTDFEINSKQNSVSMRGFISSTDSLNNLSVNSISNCLTQTYPIKNVVPKTVRKLPTNKESSNTEALNTSEHRFVNQNKYSSTKKFTNYEPVAITTSIDPNKTAGSTVILNHQSPNLSHNSCTTLHLPIGNESTVAAAERDYESIETITDAWKTLGVSDVKHTERNVVIVNNDHINFLMPKTLSYREKNPLRNLSSTKIIDIDIGESEHCHSQEGIDLNYDRLDFLSPNNKASNGYKSIVTLSSTNSIRMCCSPSTNNDYELIACPEFQSCRQAADSHLGYGIIRNPTCTSPSSLNTDLYTSPLEDNSISVSVSNEQITLKTKTAKLGNKSSSEHPVYTDLNYTIVSKPKRV